MTTILEAHALGMQYGRRRALTDCTLDIPSGHVVGLVGPNGAGKSTLLKLASGLLSPTSGSISVLGDAPGSGPAQLARVGFLAQDAPVYPNLSVADHLRLGAHLNPRWNQEFAARRIAQLDLDPAQKAGKLSGGQRAQLALTVAAGKMPELLLLDEPVASLDPLARREFLKYLMESVVENGSSVILSSHLISDLERVCDYLIVLVTSRVRLAGEVDQLIAAHHRIVCTRREPDTLPAGLEVVSAEHTDRQSTFVVRTDAPLPAGDWAAEPMSMEDLVLTYMETGGPGHRPATPVSEAALNDAASNEAVLNEAVSNKAASNKAASNKEAGR
jgi:ABC-2 type transport system ATP-binding protein